MGSRSWVLPALVVLLGTTAHALVDPQRTGIDLLPDVDSRTESDARRVDLAARSAAAAVWAAALKKERLELAVAMDEAFGTPRALFVFHGALGRITSDELRAMPANAPAVARRFLLAHRQVFGLGEADLAALRDAGTYVDRRGTVFVKVLQTRDGLDLLSTPIRMYVSPDGAVFRVNAGPYVPGLSGLAFDPRPRLGPAEAVATAAAAIGAAPAALPEVVSTGGGPGRRRIELEAGPLPSAPTAELKVLPTPDGARLVWEVHAESPHAPAFYRLAIDAHDGRLWLRENLTRYASARVWAQPLADPCGDGDCLNDDRTPVDLGQRPATAPPAYTATWIDPPPNAVLASNSVVTRQDAGLDLLIFCLDGTRRDVAARASQEFDYPVDLTQDPYDGPGLGARTDAALVQLHYLNNWIHDTFYDLGFTEAAGNFQRDNFGLGGAGNDPVIADGQDGQTGCGQSALNNANFSTPADGSSGKMQMYLWDLTPPGRKDGDLDADIVIHEFLHGVSTRAVGDMGGAQAGAMGEAWGDVYACSVAGDDRVGEYSSGWPGGIRTFPYGSSPYTILDFGSVTSGCEVHADGEIWAALMWKVRQDFLLLYPGAIPQFHQCMYDSLTLAPPRPTFTQARDAFIQAGIRLGLTECELWHVFAGIGLGYRSNGSRFDLTSSGCVSINDNDRQLQPINNLTAGFRPMPGCECPASYTASPAITAADVSVPREVALTWSPVPDNLPAYDIAAYEVWRADACTGPFMRVGFTPDGVLTLTDRGLAAGRAYAYKVRAVTTYGTACGTEGACRLVVPDCSGTPPVVTDNSLRAVRSSGTSVVFTWGALGTGSFNLHRVPFASKAALPTLHLTASLATSAAPVITDTGAFPAGLFGVYGTDCSGTSVP